MSGTKRGRGVPRNDKKQRFWPCPICNRSFSLVFLNDHVNACVDSSTSAAPAMRCSPDCVNDFFSSPSSGSLLPDYSSRCHSHDVDCKHFQKNADEDKSSIPNSSRSAGESLSRGAGAFLYQQSQCLSPNECLENFQPQCEEGENGVSAFDSCDEMKYRKEFSEGKLVQMPPPGFKLFERQSQSQARLSMLPKFPMSTMLERKPTVTVLQPGMVLFRSWLNLEMQQKLVNESHAVASLFHRPETSGGGKYHIYSMCWGSTWDTKAHRYASKQSSPPIPVWMFEMSQRLALDAQEHTTVYPPELNFAPDVGLVNFYPAKARELGVVGLGGHQDLDDSCLMPVVSVSVGDKMTFFYRRLPPLSRRKSGVSVAIQDDAAKNCQDGDAHNREHQIVLESGDVLVFGGESRLVYHGTRHVQSGTRPCRLHMVPGRLNFTFRQTTGTVRS